ncbi:MAG: DUF6328 family protein [Chloroflexota bacterium]|nr:DUF6328 family protein [Chloroflexota bacterium]
MLHEDEKERLDRELGELLQELRVMLPGVQVMLAFLLTVPFTQRFGEVTPLQRMVYFATLLCTTLATAVLIAPSVHHRVLWRQRTRGERLEIANRLAIAGTVLLALATMGAVFVVSDMLYGVTTASAFAAIVGGVLALLWYGLPLLRRRRS